MRSEVAANLRKFIIKAQKRSGTLFQRVAIGIIIPANIQSTAQTETLKNKRLNKQSKENDMTRIEFMTAKQIENILLAELSKNGKITLSSPTATLIISNVKNGKIYYNYPNDASTLCYDIDLFVRTVNDFYRQTVTVEMLRSYDNAYSSNGKPCNAVMFFLLLNYLYGVKIFGKGKDGDPYYVIIQFFNSQFFGAVIPQKTIPTNAVDFFNHVCLWRVFMKNIMLRSGNVFLSVTNSLDVLKAVKLAYLSMQPRTFRKNTPTANVNTKDKNQLLKNLSERLSKFFLTGINTQSNFDDWHKETCTWFLSELNKILNASGYSNVAYGKAQKIVNVAFKNMYLFDDAFSYEEQFILCHFIIDDANMEWCNTFALQPCKTAWSNFTYGEYIAVQNNIRKYLKSVVNYPQVPFYAEFFVWADYYKW